MISIVRGIALHTVFLNFPVVAVFGMVTFSSFLFTAFIGYTNHHGKHLIPFKWHPRMVVISFTIATFHALLALSIFI